MLTNDFDVAIKQEQTALRSMLSSLTPNQREELLAAVSGSQKSLSVAFFMCLAYGSHQIYFGDYKSQFLFWLTLGGLGVWWIFEIISLPKRVTLFNVRLKRCFVQAYIERMNSEGQVSSTQTVVLDRFQPSI